MFSYQHICFLQISGFMTHKNNAVFQVQSVDVAAFNKI